MLVVDDVPTNVDVVLSHLTGAGFRVLWTDAPRSGVLYWITEGKTNPEISAILDTTLHTIKKHNNKLFAKLGVETRMAAARLAMSVLTAPVE